MLRAMNGADNVCAYITLEYIIAVCVCVCVAVLCSESVGVGSLIESQIGCQCNQIQ